MKRNIITIDQEKCTGCGNCIPACPEGAIQMIDGKARLISDLFCDGLGACIGDCPEGAITTEFREAEPYNEKIVMERIIEQGENTVIAHLDHLWSHGEVNLYEEAISVLMEKEMSIPYGFNKHGKIPEHLLVKPGEFFIGGCESGKCMDDEQSKKDFLKLQKTPISEEEVLDQIEIPNEINFIKNWPIKLNLTPVRSQIFHQADLLIAADCVAGVVPEFNQKILKGKTLLMGCPKFDDREKYIRKLTQIFLQNEIKSVNIAIMEVPCCSSLNSIVKTALSQAKKEATIPLNVKIYRIRKE